MSGNETDFYGDPHRCSICHKPSEKRLGLLLEEDGFHGCYACWSCQRAAHSDRGQEVEQ